MSTYEKKSQSKKKTIYLSLSRIPEFTIVHRHKGRCLLPEHSSFLITLVDVVNILLFGQFSIQLVEVRILIVVVGSCVLFACEPNSFASSVSLSVSEFTHIDEVIVDLSTITMILAVFEHALVDLSRDPAFSSKSVFES